jgi:Peptidase M15
MMSAAILSGDLSPNFSWQEASITQVRGVDNSIPESLRANVRFTATKMEQIRALLSRPILINSWYRSAEVNTIVGGSKNSAHMSGCAVDFISPGFGSPYDICARIAKYADIIAFDQLIYEHSWVHVGFSVIPGAKARKQVLTLLSAGGYANGLTDKSGKKLGV